MIDRAALRRSYRPDENVLAAQRVSEAKLSTSEAREAAAMARSIIFSGP